MKRKYILWGFILSILLHSFILPGVLSRVRVERDFSYPQNDEYIDFISLEDVIVPIKKKKKEKTPEKKVVRKKEKERQKTPKKKEEVKTKKKETMENIEAYDYKSVPIIDPKQRFSIKKNKRPKGSEKLGEASAPQMTIPEKHMGIAKQLGAGHEGKRRIDLRKMAKNAAPLNKEKQGKARAKANRAEMVKARKHKAPVPKALAKAPTASMGKAIISSSPLLEDKSFAREHEKKADIEVTKAKKLRSYSVWDSFSTKDLKVTKEKQKRKDTLSSMPKLSMISPPRINDSITLQNTLDSRKLLRGDVFDLDELQRNLGGIGSLLEGRSKGGRNFGSLTIGDPDFSNEWYARVIVSRVAQHWYLPVIAYSGASGITTISFSIIRSGEIIKQTTSKTSEYPSIDESSSNAVSLSGAFPPLPDDYSKDKLDIKFSFYVNLMPPSRR